MRLIRPFDIKVAKEDDDYSIYFADWTYQKNSIRKIDPSGTISTVAGGVEEDTLDRENRPATIEPFNAWGIALSPDGGLYINDNSNHRLRCVQTYLPRFGNEAFLIPSRNGSVVYAFDAYGRHLKTRHGLTGGTLLTFGFGNPFRYNHRQWQDLY